MFQDKVKEITEKVKSSGIVISRVPKKTKNDFIAVAEEEFCGDYGMLMKVLVDDYFLFKKIKESLINNKIKIVFENENK